MTPTMHSVKEEVHNFIEKNLENSPTLPTPSEVAQGIIAPHGAIEGKDAEFHKEAASQFICEIVESLYADKTADEVSHKLKNRLRVVRDS
jgi:hypothetical protein